MTDLEDLPPSSILHNPIYLTLILLWLPPGDILNCAPVCKQWSTGVSQAWKSFLQRSSPLLYGAAVNAANNENQESISPEMLFKHFALSEYKLRQDLYNLPTDTFENYQRALEIRELKQRHKDAISIMSLAYKQSHSQESSNFTALKLEDLLLVVHLYHFPTRTPMASVIWNMNEVMEDGFIYGKGAPMLTKEVEFRIPVEASVTENNSAVPGEIFTDGPRNEWRRRYVAASLDEVGIEMMETSIVSVQVYRCDQGKAVSFERAQMMRAANHDSRLLGSVRTNLRKSRINPNPASSPLPHEDDEYFDPAVIPASMSVMNKQYPCIGFEVGVRNLEPMNVARLTPMHKVGKMTLEVHLRMFELFPGHHRTTIRWKEDLRKHLQHMDWE